MFRVFLGLGSNLGDRLSYVSHALQEIAKVVTVRAISSVYETEPVGYKPQPEFLNLVMEVETPFDPQSLFKKLKVIETAVGRQHNEHMKSREIDIDILLYVGLKYSDESVTVPHLELHNRRFVLEPLNEIAFEVIHPMLNATISVLLHQCSDGSRVVRRRDIHVLEPHQLSS